MRLLGLFGDGFGGFGGMSRFNCELLAALCEHEEMERAVGVARSGAGRAVGIPEPLEWSVVPSKAAFTATAMARAVSMRPDVVICGHANLAPAAAAAAALAGARLWSIGHGIEVWDPAGRLASRGLERSDLITTVSRYTRRRLLEWISTPPERVRVLSDTYDPEAFGERPFPAKLAERYGLAGRRVLFTLGRLAANEGYKGHDRVIECLPSLLTGNGDLAYLIAGDGTDRPRLERLARERGVEERVVFAGRIPEEEIADHYRLADVFVMPSTGEGFGIVFLEAAACGTPVVAGRRDGSADALRDGTLGILVDPHDPRDVERGILEALGRGRGVPGDLAVFGPETFAPQARAMLDRVVEST